MAASDNDSRNLLELAVDIHTDLGKLAVGLAHAGANPQAVATLTKIGGVIGDIAKGLGSGPVGAQGPPEPAAGPPGAAPGGPPEPGAGPPAPAAAAGPPQGTLPGERPNGLHEATQHLQAALALKRQQQAQGR